MKTKIFANVATIIIGITCIICFVMLDGEMGLPTIDNAPKPLIESKKESEVVSEVEGLKIDQEQSDESKSVDKEAVINPKPIDITTDFTNMPLEELAYYLDNGDYGAIEYYQINYIEQGVFPFDGDLTIELFCMTYGYDLEWVTEKFHHDKYAGYVQNFQEFANWLMQQ